MFLLIKFMNYLFESVKELVHSLKCSVVKVVESLRNQKCSVECQLSNSLFLKIPSGKSVAHE